MTQVEGRMVELHEAATVRAAFEAAVAMSSISKFARRAGISAAVVSRVRAGEPLGVAIPRALGWEKVVGFVRTPGAPPLPTRVPLEQGDRERLVEMGLGGEAPRPRRAAPIPLDAVVLSPIDAETASADDGFVGPSVDIESGVLGTRVREANAVDEGEDE